MSRDYQYCAQLTFPRMAEILKPTASEHFMVDIFDVTPEDVKRVQFLDRLKGRCEYEEFESGKYARLSHREPDGSRGAPIMSDTWMEKESNMAFYRAAKGKVLIAGLGLGMVVLAVQKKPEVSAVYVIEKSQEVIDLVKPQLPLNEKVRVIWCDIFNAEPRVKFDTVYFDIWDTICGDNWTEMKRLVEKFRPLLNRGAWISSWRKDDCRRMARKGY